VYGNSGDEGKLQLANEERLMIKNWGHDGVAGGRGYSSGGDVSLRGWKEDEDHKGNG